MLWLSVSCLSTLETYTQLGHITSSSSLPKKLRLLKILGRIPFAFSTMDRGGSKGEGAGAGGMVASMVEQGKQRLGDAGRTREAAAELLSRIITRPDLVLIPTLLQLECAFIHFISLRLKSILDLTWNGVWLPFASLHPIPTPISNSAYLRRWRTSSSSARGKNYSAEQVVPPHFKQH